MTIDKKAVVFLQKTCTLPRTRWLILRILIGFCLLLLLGLWLCLTVFLDPLYRQTRMSDVHREARSLGDIIAQSNLPAAWDTGSDYQIQNSTAVAPLTQKVQEQGDLRLELWSQELGVTYVLDTQTWQAGIPTRRDSLFPVYDKLTLLEQAKSGTTRTRFERFGSEYALCARVIPTPQESEILLLVVAPLHPTDAANRVLRHELLLITAFMLLASVITAILLSRKITRPIHSLVKSAREMGAGKLNTTFERGETHEIALLADTLRGAAAELGKTDTLRRELIANVSHDLRTPLTLIHGYAEMMHDLPGENTPENIGLIAAESERLRALVEDLLDLSRLETGTVAVTPERFNLTQNIRELTARFQKFCPETAITLSIDEDVFVFADPMRIGQVMTNFIQNAIQHAEAEHPAVTVTQTAQDGMVTFSVADNGRGIPAEEQPKIWDRYYRAAQNRTRGEGSGLGLNIVKNILERHIGAQYGVRSAEGVGSTFWFALHIAPTE